MPAFDATTADLTYSIRDNWGSGLVVDLELTAGAAVDGWTIVLEYDGDIVNLWNADIVSRDGDRYVIQAKPYNAVLAEGGVAGFGFQGTGGSTITPVSVNGAPFGGDPDPEPEPEPDPQPVVSVGDAVASEEEGEIAFTLSLSEPSDTPVVVQYETVAGTAGPDGDFVPQVMQVTIPAGESSVEVTIPLVNDDVPEGTESFRLRLTDADGAVIGDGIATGTITDSDVAPEPESDPIGLTVDAPSVTEGDPDAGPVTPGGTGGGLIADGPLVTDGNQIVDVNGDTVQIRAVNWFGAEGTLGVPHGLWTRSMTSMMDQMVDEGFNAIRLPFSVEAILENRVVQGVEGDPSLAGLTTLEVFDRIVAYAEEIGIKIILDCHRSTSGAGADGIWYNDQYSQNDWIVAWETLAGRFGGSDAVIGADLYNEPHYGTWGDGGPNDWAIAAELAGKALLDIAPDWLVVVEGIGNYQGDNYWWGGNLQGVRDRPIDLGVDNKLVYSPHDYPASVFDQPWFRDGSDLFKVFREHWGYIYEEGIAPILLGEFGSRLETQIDQAWAEAIVAYLGGDFDGDGIVDIPAGDAGMSFAWWSWNPNSGDTGGYLNDDWTTVRLNAADLLDPLLEAVSGETGDPDPDPVYLTFTVTLDAPATEALVLAYTTIDGTATAGVDYVETAGVLSFAVDDQTATILVEVLPDTIVEGDETLSLVLTDAVGTEFVTTGTIVDDDTGGPPDPDPDPDPGTVGDDGSGQLDARLKVVNDWGGGAIVELEIRNVDAFDFRDGWALRLDLGMEIGNMWNGSWTGTGDGGILVTNASWNGTIGAGGSVIVGMQVSQGNLDELFLNDSADFLFI